MFKGYRDGTFGFGLAVGAFSIIVFVIFGEHLYEFVKCITGSEDHCSYAPKDGDREPDWWHWTRRFIAAEDTLAQWVMAGFTIVAAALLWLTLKQANKTNIAAISAAKAARDAVLVAEDSALRQTRAYVVFTSAKTSYSDGKMWIELAFENMGSTPARDFECLATIKFIERGQPVKIFFGDSQGPFGSRQHVGKDLSIKQGFPFHSTGVSSLTENGTHDMYVVRPIFSERANASRMKWDARHVCRRRLFLPRRF